jgi:photosystem II stability/assembly factor-like uncharacterized protein
LGRLILVGTKKGLFFIQDGRLSGPELTGWSIYHAVADQRTGQLYTASNNEVYGGVVHRSTDGGETWKRNEPIELGELPLGEVWHVEPGHASESEVLFLGAAPGLLLRSDDSGATWRAVDGLVSHPTRPRWMPGAGGMCCHSIQVDSPSRLLVAISAAGAFRSDDGGASFVPVNRDVAADFMPEKYPEVGQCVHKLLQHPARPGRLWQQNHCGVYRSDDWGDTWERLDGNGLPSSFGFPIMLDPGDPNVAYVIPEEGAENRVTSGGRLGVYRTADAGSTWQLHAKGLPERAWSVVLREASSFDEYGPVFGTQSGSVWGLEGDTWHELARDLPPILSVEVTAGVALPG